MAKQSRKKTVEGEQTAPITELTGVSNLDTVAEIDVSDRYAGIEVREGRVLLEQVGTGKEQPPFILVNALKVKVHADGTATVNGYLTDGKSNIYKVIKKKA